VARAGNLAYAAGGGARSDTVGELLQVEGLAVIEIESSVALGSRASAAAQGGLRDFEGDCCPGL
jgi:hypothetical protein